MGGVSIEAVWHGDDRELSSTIPLTVLGAIEKRFGVSMFYAEFRDGDFVEGGSVTADIRRSLLKKPVETLTASLVDRDGVEEIGRFSLDTEDDPAFLFIDFDDGSYFDIGSTNPFTEVARELIEDLAAGEAVAVSVRPQDVGSYLSGEIENEAVFLYYYFRDLNAMLEVINELIEASREYASDLGFDPAVEGTQQVRASAVPLRVEDIGFPGRMARFSFIPPVPIDYVSLDEITRICQMSGYHFIQRIPSGLIFEAATEREQAPPAKGAPDLQDRREALLPRLTAYLVGLSEHITSAARRTKAP